MPESVIKEALEQFAESQDGSDYNRQAAEDDIRFARLGEQWPDNIEKLRRDEGRPCLTINRLPAYIRQVVNEARQNKPGVKVSPVDSGADVETAEVIGGLIRSIERGSQAEVAYDTAIDHAVTNGFGFFRIGIDYAHEDSFNLEAKIERVPNPLMVHWDVSSTQFDASDWDYAFISEMLTEDEFEKSYPGKAKSAFTGNDVADYWMEQDHIRVAEYWARELKTRKLFLLSDGTAMRAEQIVSMTKKFIEGLGQDVGGYKDEELISEYLQRMGLEVRKERDADYYEVSRRIISGVEILDEEKWPGSMIPICPVWGEEVFSDGRRYFRSMIRDAKDPQRMYNFWRSATTELVALAPKAPWLIEEGGIPKGKEGKWQSANTRSHPYLEYTKGTNMPQRQPFASAPAGALQEAANANQDMQDITGIYPSSIGARSNEVSGKAILTRERQGDISNFHFIDNLSRAIKYAGEVLVEIIPAVYSPRESVRILGDDMREKVVSLTMQDGGSKEDGIGGEPRLYNLAVGKYDVTVSSGPSYATQREETREALIEIMRNIPDSALYIGDVLMEHLDFVGADKVAKRLQMLLPPQIQASEGIQPAMPVQIPGAPIQAQPGQQPAPPVDPNMA